MGWRQDSLAALHKRSKGKCKFCGGHTVIVPEIRHQSPPSNKAVRYKVLSGFGKPGRVRKRVLACRKCAQEQSDSIQNSIPLEERQARARAWPTEEYVLVDKEALKTREGC